MEPTPADLADTGVASAVSEPALVPVAEVLLRETIFPFLTKRLTLRAVFSEREDASESESDDDDSEDDGLKYCAAGPGTVSVSTMCCGVEA